MQVVMAAVYTSIERGSTVEKVVHKTTQLFGMEVEYMLGAQSYESLQQVSKL